MDLDDRFEAVKNAQSFLEFAKALLEDRLVDIREDRPDQSDRTARGWVNTSLEDFLESATAWAESSNFGDINENPWREFATFLYCGKTYE